MSVMVKPRIATFSAAAAISKGMAVYVDSTGKIVTKVSGTTSKAIGIAQNTVTTAGDLVEVALSGGGAKGLAKTTINAGDILGFNADASIQKLASANDRMIGIAMEDAAAADLFQVDVIVGMGTQTQS
jgi:hypothetical protein